MPFDPGIFSDLSQGMELEWLETNGLGDYASSTAPCVNTRRYHGLLVANLRRMDRHVLLSTLEDWLCVGEESYPLSCRVHPGAVHPKGHETLQEWSAAGHPRFVFEAGGYRLTRELVLLSGRHCLLVRYTLKALDRSLAKKPALLRVSPLLAFRFFHALTSANMDLQVKTYPARAGFKIQPYNALPPLYMQTEGDFDFLPSPDWIYRVEYPRERERGFDFSEDLFSPGLFELSLAPGQSVILSASTEELQGEGSAPPPLARLWRSEIAKRARPSGLPKGTPKLLEELASASRAFLSTTYGGRSLVIAGYPWFGSWGRDSLIALPGLSFLAGRLEEGRAALSAIAKGACDGLVPNTFDCDGRPRGYNSVDASLWLAWDCQLLLQELMRRGLEASDFLDLCAPAIYAVVSAFRSGHVPFARVAATGLLEVGTPQTQLTWMDAQVDGRPVTPRNGFPVEIQALWYNTLAFAHDLALRRGDPDPASTRLLRKIRKVFAELFVLPDGSLCDVWRPESQGGPDRALRPNQLLAVSMPEPIAPWESWEAIVARVRERLLTPFGLRTLDPAHPDYRPAYEGGPGERDSAYHQGTVWPWLVGPYADALLRLERLEGRTPTQAVKELLETLTPLVAGHRREACVGHVSEIFSAEPPFRPDGAFAQAWSEGELFRALLVLREADPEAWEAWAEGLDRPSGN